MFQGTDNKIMAFTSNLSTNDTTLTVGLNVKQYFFQKSEQQIRRSRSTFHILKDIYLWN